VSSEHPAEPVVIRDKRKIDPVTGEAREVPAEATAPAGSAAEDDVPKAEALLLEERTRDLQRVQAEYANYRKRAERERSAAGDVAVSRVLTELLPVLDDIDRARSHGDLTGGLKAISDQLELVLSKLGLAAFGEEGDVFDPTIHEAVMHNESPEVTEPSCTTVMRKGYRHGDRLLRPAMVGVSDPASDAAADPTPAAQAAPSEAADEIGDEPADNAADE
jgi:molecular chaperone GrpE